MYAEGDTASRSAESVGIFKFDVPIDNVGLHAMENLPCNLDGRNHCTQTLVEKDYIGRRARSVRSALDGDSAIGLFQTGRIVDSVARHGRQVSPLLEERDDLILVFWEYFGEPISAFEKVAQLTDGQDVVS